MAFNDMWYHLGKGRTQKRAIQFVQLIERCHKVNLKILHVCYHPHRKKVTRVASKTFFLPFSKLSLVKYYTYVTFYFIHMLPSP